MKIYRLLIPGLLILAIGPWNANSAAADPAQDELLNDGEDLTRPVNRFDTRFRFETLPDATQSGKLFDNVHAETMTFRTDLVFFPKPDQFALRVDLPMAWNNKPTSENANGVTRFGLGDLLVQTLYVHTFDSRWAGAVGWQTIFPTATGLAFGSGKYQLAPTVGARAGLPEISAGSYVGFAVREFVSVGGDAARANINSLSFEPAFNVQLPEQWFLNTNPKIRYNLESSKWFVPLDLTVGKKFGVHWVVSIEYQYGLVRDAPRYNQWVEGRVGYFF